MCGGGGQRLKWEGGGKREWIRKRILFTQGKGGRVEPEIRGEGQQFKKLG